jgi:hypothetical protein
VSHLDTLTPLIGIIARERTSARPDLYDDARQEGLIRAWTVEQAKPDAPRQYVLAAARRGIADVVRGRPSFGAASHRGNRDAADSAHGFHLDAETAEDFAAELADPAAEAALLRVEDRDAYRRVLVSVRALSPTLRRVVELRLAGEEFAAIGRAVGVSTATAHRRYMAAVVALRADQERAA